MQSILKNFWRQRSFRFIFVGAITTLANILLINLLVSYFKLNDPILKSLGNAFATEICLLLSFFCYRQFVWQAVWMGWQKVLFHELPRYHLSIISVIVIRIFLLFPLLDWLGVHYSLNTLIGIALGAASSYTLSNKFVFNIHKTYK